MRIAKHDKSYIVELSDSSGSRIRPADMPGTLQWLPTTEIDVREIEDEICSQVRVTKASRKWEVHEVWRSLSD
jgi:hypothetical protein